MDMTPEDIGRLKHAIDLLENPGLAAKLTNVIGIPFKKAFAMVAYQVDSIVSNA